MLSPDEAAPCGDGMVKGVKVAWPGSKGQREEFPLRSVQRDRFARAARIRVRTTNICVYACIRVFVGRRLAYVRSRVHLMTRRRSPDASLSTYRDCIASDLSATAAIYLRVWFIDSSTRGRPR